MNKGTILIVDDTEIVLIGLQRVLEKEGYEIIVTTSPKQALEIIKEKNFDLVYTDMKMPEMNGDELCKEIKKINPEIEVVVFSGTPEGIAQHQLEFLKSGGKDIFLRKPIGKDEIIEATKRLMK
ncbi:MAG: response regulator [Candidatus Omnitrophica bacterium]|nr:response regulator [Candidatus Omnitrophota bacterium]MCK5394067.1 response regulator [Candidatus Omnitrophota bacterium]MCK5491488.1 response regulator [Candidatus Omnitrophota bacterium]